MYLDFFLGKSEPDPLFFLENLNLKNLSDQENVPVSVSVKNPTVLLPSYFCL